MINPTALRPVRTEHTTVLIAGDHPIYRSGLRSLLEGVDSLHVVGEVGTGPEAVVMTRRLRPRVLLMDVVLRGVSLAEMIGDLTECCPETGVLIVSLLDDRETFLSAMRAGARGYLLNGAHSQDLALAIEIVRAGGLAFDSCASDWVIDDLSRSSGIDRLALVTDDRDEDRGRIPPARREAVQLPITALARSGSGGSLDAPSRLGRT